MKQLIFSLTAKDFDFDFYVGRGKGGQKRNKTSNCCRCTHPPSGVFATSEEGRSQQHNKKVAFNKVVNDPKFRSWLRLETARRDGELAEVKRSMSVSNLKVETKQNGKWVSV